MYKDSFSFTLLCLSDVYARKHSSRHKVERLVYYFRYMPMPSDSEILNHKVVCLDKGRTRERQNTFKGNWHYWVCFVFDLSLYLKLICVYWSIVSHSHSPFCSRLNGSVVYVCIYIWNEQMTRLTISHIHNYHEFINR